MVLYNWQTICSEIAHESTIIILDIIVCFYGALPNMLSSIQPRDIIECVIEGKFLTRLDSFSNRFWFWGTIASVWINSQSFIYMRNLYQTSLWRQKKPFECTATLQYKPISNVQYTLFGISLDHNSKLRLIQESLDLHRFLY